MATAEQNTSDLGIAIRTVAAEQQLFGRYTSRKVLGRGGMGIVWLAHDDELKRNVAMKFLPDMIIRDREAVEDLKRETRRSLDLTHHHIVRIYDFTQDDSCAAIVMEYVDGDSLSALKTHQEAGCFGVSTIQNWVGHFCQAMDYAHRQARVVHRDLKPANLMVNGRGDLKVTDFGISRSMSDSMTRVSMSNSAGTLAYMSPEQALGSPPAAGDDIYAFGATVYDLLTGRPPFFRGNLQVQLETVIPPAMDARRAELGNTSEPIPALWEEVIAACLAKRPADRPQSMIEIANLLGVGAGSSVATGFRFGSTHGGPSGVPGTTPTAVAPGTAPTQQRTVDPEEMRTEELAPSSASKPSRPAETPTRTQKPPVATRQEDVLLNIAPHIASRPPVRGTSPSASNGQPPTGATNRSAAPAPEYTPPIFTRPPGNADADEVIEPHTIRGANESEAAANVGADYLVDESVLEEAPPIQEGAPMQPEAAGEYADALPSMAENPPELASGQSFVSPATRHGHLIGQPGPKPKSGRIGILLGGLAAIVLAGGLGIYFGSSHDPVLPASGGEKEEPVIDNPLPVEPPPPTESEKLVIQAQELFKADNLAEAQKSLTEALALEPENADAIDLMKDVKEGIAEDELAAQKNEILARVDAALVDSKPDAARKALEGLPAALKDDRDIMRKEIDISNLDKELAEMATKKAEEIVRNNQLELKRIAQEEAAAKAARTAQANEEAAARRAADRKRTAEREESQKRITPPVRRAAQTTPSRPPPPVPQKTKQRTFRRTPFGGGAPGG